VLHRTALSISENAILKKKKECTALAASIHSTHIQKYFWIEAASAVHSLHRTLDFGKRHPKKKKKHSFR
jgi:hypothetical protein